MNPTKKQREVFDFIKEFISANHYSPSYREIMGGMGLKSVSTVAKHVDGLVAMGMIQRADGAIRCLEVVKQSKVSFIHEVERYIAEHPEETENIKILRKASEILNETI